jgi:hypothetical protein
MIGSYTIEAVRTLVLAATQAAIADQPPPST